MLKDRYLSGMILPLIGSGLPVSMSEIWNDLASDRSLRPSLRDKKLDPFRRSFSLNDVSPCLPGPRLVPIIGPEVIILNPEMMSQKSLRRSGLIV